MDAQVEAVECGILGVWSGTVSGRPVTEQLSTTTNQTTLDVSSLALGITPTAYVWAYAVIAAYCLDLRRNFHATCQKSVGDLDQGARKGARSSGSRGDVFALGSIAS